MKFPFLFIFLVFVAAIFAVANLLVWPPFFSRVVQEQDMGIGEAPADEPQGQKENEGASSTPRETQESSPALKASPIVYTCEEVMANSPFWRDDSLQAFRVELSLRDEGKEEIANQLQAISCVPQGIWVNGKNPNWEAGRVKESIEKANLQEKIPVFVVYDGPNHEDAGWRHVESGNAYSEWIRLFGNAIGNAKVWIILEPDALPLAFTYPSVEREKRFSELKAAIQTLQETSPSAKVYLDAGHGQWKSPEVIAEFLQRAGVAQTAGFSLNVSNHQTVREEIAYGKVVSQLLGGAHFVIDTGQSGKKVEGQEWCNAAGRALGNLPTIDTDDSLVDAFLWVKPPGESDGTCNGGPPAGKFWLEYALQLTINKP